MDYYCGNTLVINFVNNELNKLLTTFLTVAPSSSSPMLPPFLLFLSSSFAIFWWHSTLPRENTVNYDRALISRIRHFALHYRHWLHMTRILLYCHGKLRSLQSYNSPQIYASLTAMLLINITCKDRNKIYN